MKLKRVVITGLGALTPIGNNIKDYWESLKEGKSGAGPITYFDTSLFKTKFACEIKNYDPGAYISQKEQLRTDRCAQYGMIVAQQAVEDSGLNQYEKLNKNRVGVIWGSGIGGIKTFEEEVTRFALGDGIPRFNPFFIPKMIVDITPGLISMHYGYRGPNFTAVSACASSSNAIIDSYNCIALGQADVVVTGGSEASITQSGIAGFNALHALSTRNKDPKTASRPFDKDRDGFVMGEGAGGLILESYEHATARKAKIYAEVVGVGLSADAYHLTAPHPEGTGVILAMQNALAHAGIRPEDVDHINTHGTSTPLGDLAELKGIKQVFGASTQKMAINSTKSMTGHLLGATGAIEAIASVLAMHYSCVPPTINNFELDPAIDPSMNLILNEKQNKSINFALSNTFGFGGHNTSILFKNI